MSLMQRTPSNLSLCMSPGGAPSAPIAIGRDDDDSPSGRGTGPRVPPSVPRESESALEKRLESGASAVSEG